MKVYNLCLCFLIVCVCVCLLTGCTAISQCRETVSSVGTITLSRSFPEIFFVVLLHETIFSNNAQTNTHTHKDERDEQTNNKQANSLLKSPTAQTALDILTMSSTFQHFQSVLKFENMHNIIKQDKIR